MIVVEKTVKFRVTSIVIEEEERWRDGRHKVTCEVMQVCKVYGRLLAIMGLGPELELVRANGDSEEQALQLAMERIRASDIHPRAKTVTVEINSRFGDPGSTEGGLQGFTGRGYGTLP